MNSPRSSEGRMQTARPGMRERIGERASRRSVAVSGQMQQTFQAGLPSIKEMIEARNLLDTQYGLKGYKISDYDGKMSAINLRKQSTQSDWNRAKGSFIDIGVK